MDKNAIKKFAIWAREELMRRVSAKAEEYGISPGGIGENSAVSAHGRPLSGVEQAQRRRLVERVRREGYERVVEEAAYTWFNRFIALRFMEVNNYLPSRVRVFTNEENQFRPQIMAEALHLELEGLDRDRVIALKQANDDGALYKYLLITQCNALSAVLPRMFQRIEDCTELLFPDNILREGSVIERMTACIPEEDWTDQVQIIGWLYQYYNTEPKAKVFARPSGQKIQKEDLPAATQLFTPDWIVRYMVENSLGRLWAEGHECGGLKAGWKYYLEEAGQEPEVLERLEELRGAHKNLSPEDIRVIDPCMGSGHILVYAFDVLAQIYESYGYSARDAVRCILEHNLYGLDIDGRAAQLAYFSVMMTAVKHDSRFLRRNNIPQPNLFSPKGCGDGEEFGSLLTVDRLEEMPQRPEEATLFDGDYEIRLNRWNFRRLLAQKYHVVVTNPPYMAVSNASGRMQEYIKKNFPDSKADLFAVFIERCGQLAKENGCQAMITQHAWMFLSSFEKLRAKLQAVDTVNMVHLGARAFEEIGGEVVQTTSFVLRKSHVKGYKGTYCRLIEPNTQQGKEEMFLSGENRYAARQDDFAKIPGAPVAYWVSQILFDIFSHSDKLSEHCDVTRGLTTGDNDLYLRLWHEVEWTKISVQTKSIAEAKSSRKKWFPHNKGGEFRNWYGNNELVVNFEDEGASLKKFYEINKAVRFTGIEYYFTQGITWTALSSGRNSFRFSDCHIFDSNKGPMLFAKNNKIFYILGFLNSKVSNNIVKILNPTLSLQNADMNNIPYIENIQFYNKIIELSKTCVNISCADWDSFETSWDFTRHPLVRGAATVAEAYAAWAAECETRFSQLKANEEELNRIFIDIYGLQDELTPEVEDKDVTVRRADLGRDIRSLISYAVGCMFGRYSLDVEGLAYAGGRWDASKYKAFQPDKDAILPICDDEYFEDDITGRFVQWVEAVYGRPALEENLKFIADALGGRGSPREAIRSYFLNGFYADHCKIYQKRPIYWLFDSGKKGGFKALVYLHRYQPDTAARIRTDYVHEQQARYRTAAADLERRAAAADTAGKVRLGKALDKLREQDAELRGYEEKIHHLADQMIQLDLDDGVKVNYARFQDVLAKIK